MVFKYRTPRKESNESLRRNVKIFHYLCRASSGLNDVFSLPAFFILTTKLLFVITVSYVFIYNFFHPNYFFEDYSMAFPYMFVMDSVRIFVLLASADMPVNQVILRTNWFHRSIISIILFLFFIDQVRLLRERVTEISCTGSSQTSAEKIAVLFFMIIHRRDLKENIIFKSILTVFLDDVYSAANWRRSHPFIGNWVV